MNSEINGKVWQDLNSNGFQDSFEPGIADWTVYLDENQNGELDVGEYSTLTNEYGEYSFFGLESGIYTVAQTVLPGWQQLSPHPNSNKERLFVIPDDGYNQIVELNPLTGTEIYRFTAPTWIGGRFNGLAFNGTRLFLTNESNQLWELDPNTGAVIDDYWVNRGGGFGGLATLGSKVYLLDSWASDIIEFDPIREEVTNVLDIDQINPGVYLKGGLSGDTGLSSVTPGVFTDTGIIGDNGNPYTPNFIPGSDVDFYKVELSRRERITIDIDAQTVGSKLDAELRLFDFMGREVASSTNNLAPGETKFSGDPYLDFTASNPGTYYIGVSSQGNRYNPAIPNSGFGNSSGGYNIKDDFPTELNITTDEVTNSYAFSFI
ncbi:MAG: SdrD B-like domain-containing protein [Coleofasciculus sp. G3-WIS-01]|uniref:SdrD B-like domain-containing protein n=1 Tax=Coleofasciculus sp. G3-WIS-01 TaxID=3069528 RepID=UPI0032FDE7E2